MNTKHKSPTPNWEKKKKKNQNFITLYFKIDSHERIISYTDIMYPWYKKNKSPFFSLECFQLLSATPSMYCSHVTPFVFAIRSDMTYRPVLWAGAPTLLYTTYNNCLMHAHYWKANSSVVKVSAYATDLQAQCYLKHNVLLLLNSNAKC